MPHELKNREIFAVGEWNGMEFTDEDLDDIVANFNKLAETHKVPLKFGHDADHNDGQPAIGWITSVMKQGQKLYADFSHMPRTVFDAIKNKLYRTVSIELLFNVDNDGKKFNHVLDAVALLGADHPAVNSLADLDALLAKRTKFIGGHKLAFETIAGTSKKFDSKKGDAGMDDKKVQDLIDAALKPLSDANVKLTADLEAANSQIAKFTKDKADDEADALKETIKASRKAVVEVLDEAVRQKTLTPAFREVYEKQIGLDDDDRVVTIKLDEVKSMFSVTKVSGQQGLEKDGDDDIDNPEAELLVLTRKNMSESGEKDFHAAFSATAAANPKLHRAYLDANGVK